MSARWFARIAFVCACAASLVCGGRASIADAAGEVRAHGAHPGALGTIALADTPICAVDSLEIDFGGVQIGTPVYRQFRLVNAGKGTLIVSPIASCPEFFVEGSGEFVVDAGDTVVARVGYVPIELEADTCLITVGSGCPDIVCTGYGICPDLQVTAFSFSEPPSIFPGQVVGGSIAVTVRISNLRGGIVTPVAALYISADSTITRSDRQLTGGRIGLVYEVPPDSSVDLRLLIPIGVSMPQFQAGPAYLGVIVDDFNAVVECDETNNTGVIPVTVVPASEAAALSSFTESWTSGVDLRKWLIYGEPEPKSTTNAICDSVPGVDPKGDGDCYSGLWMKEPVAWRLGSRLMVQFATNVTGARRSPSGQSLRFGLCGGWDPLPPCEGAFGPVIPRLWASVNMATGGSEVITLLADGVGEIVASIPYPAEMDTTCHTLAFLNSTDGRVRVEFDGVTIGISPDNVSLPYPLYPFIDGESVDITNIVSEIELSPGIVSPASLEFPTTNAGDVAILPLDIWNPDTLPLPIDSIALGAAPFALTPTFAESLGAGLELPPGARIETKMLYTPLDGGNHDTQAVLFSRGDTLITFPMRGKSIGLDFSWNNPEDYDPREITEGERVRIKVQLGDAVAVDSVVLHYSKGEMRDFLSEPMTRIEDPFNDRARYQAVIPGEMADASGLEFYITAHNGSAVSKFRSAQAPELLRVRVASLDFDHLPPPEKYAMISLPLDLPPDVDLMSFLRDDLGNDDSSLWRMFAFDRRARVYEELHADSVYFFRQGEAYWLIKRGPLALDGPEDRIGLSTPLDSAFTISLSPGWNMIANPFAMTVAWDSCLIDGVPTPAAEQAGTISPLLFWDWSQSAYLDSNEVFWPFLGYWLRNETAASVTLSVPPIPEGTISTERPLARGMPATARSGAKPVDESGWRVRIIATTAGAKDLINVIGASAGADESWDPLDRVEPPLVPGEAIALHFPHADWGDRAGRYTADIRPDGAPGEWAFDVARTTSADQGNLVTLQFEGLESLPGDLDLVLTDRALGREIDLRLVDEYRFVCGGREMVSSEGDCRFALRVASREGDAPVRAPNSDRVLANIPNPFNPATVIHYDVAEAGEVQLRIFDAAGALVRALFTGWRAPGGYEAAWDGKDDHGADAPSGIYFTRMERGPASSSVRMVLLR